MNKAIQIVYVAIFVVLWSCATSLGQNWTIQTVHDIPSRYTSLRLDSQGYPHISYQFWDGQHKIGYARWNGSEWAIGTVGLLGGNSGHGTSLALDQGDRPRIAYNSYLPGHGVDYAAWNGVAWEVETIESGLSGNVGRRSSLALDGSGNPRLSYYDNSAFDGKYAWRDQLGWHIEVIPSANRFGLLATSLALDQSGAPHVVGRENSRLTYAVREDLGWVVQDRFVSGGRAATVVLDGEGNPHIAHQVFNARILKYTFWDGDQWHTETVDDSGSVRDGSVVGLALDSQGKPRFTYRRGGYLYHAMWNGTGWATDPVGYEGPEISDTSLVIDEQGYSHISYGLSDEGLRYAVGIPEPASAILLLIGLNAAVLRRRNR